MSRSCSLRENSLDVVLTLIALLSLTAPVRAQSSTDLPEIAAVVDAASYRPVIAPGGLLTIFGERLAADSATAQSVPLPFVLGSARVLVDGRPIPLFFASPEQLNGQVLYGVGTGEIEVIVEVGGVKSSPFITIVRNRAPAIFQFPHGTCIAQRSSGALISPESPVAAGDAFTVYTTGQGRVTPIPAEGAPASSAPLSVIAEPSAFRVRLDGKEVERGFHGLTPGLVSLGQLNLIAPEIEHGGTANLAISSDGRIDNGCRLPVTSFVGDQPQIEMVSVPPIGSSENLIGRVANAPASDFQVAVLIRVGGWWTKPFANRPATPIRPDGTWEADITTGGNDVSASAIIAYLVGGGFQVPVALGSQQLPESLEAAAVAKVLVEREPPPPAYRGRVLVPVGSEFDAGLDGWSGGSEIRFQSGIGNSPGSMEFQELYRGSGFASAPPKFLGFWSSLDGKGFISFQHRVALQFSPGFWGAAVPREIRLSGPGGSAVWQGAAPEFSNNWVSVSVKLDQAEWTVTSGTWQNLLDQVTAFEIRVDHFNDLFGVERAQFDSVRLLPGVPVGE